MQQKFVMAIDGIVASGKDVLATNLQSRKFFGSYSTLVFNCGDLFRAVAFQAMCENINPDDMAYQDFVLETMARMDFFAINKQDLFTSEVDRLVSYVPAVEKLRPAYIKKASQIISSAPADVVIGMSRTLGKLEYPQADVKIYLDVSDEVSAQRRALARMTPGADFEELKEIALKRNQKDRENWGDAMSPAADAIIINTDHLSSEQVYAEVTRQIAPIFEKFKR